MPFCSPVYAIDFNCEDIPEQSALVNLALVFIELFHTRSVDGSSWSGNSKRWLYELPGVILSCLIRGAPVPHIRVYTVRVRSLYITGAGQIRASVCAGVSTSLLLFERLQYNSERSWRAVTRSQIACNTYPIRIDASPFFLFFSTIQT